MWCVFAAVDYWSYILVYNSEVPVLISTVANNEDSICHYIDIDKSRYLSVRLHGVIPQNIVLSVFTAMRITNLTITCRWG
jgi:hypothetical protein